MDPNFISALVATLLTCFLLIATMSAGLVQVVLEKRSHKIINVFIIAFLSGSLMLSMFVLMYPASQKAPDISDISKMDVPSTLFNEPTHK
jgi:hypothetical protein